MIRYTGFNGLAYNLQVGRHLFSYFPCFGWRWFHKFDNGALQVGYLVIKKMHAM
jgi:hypothetical protein